ncbi:urease accessory protein UreD [Ectopseudomonas khazarica]|uniref:urease accessory protein UreD n=1 Tax=Ectopseudomonas khazarica TaxID=2502979 RepID=UPI0037CBD67D
MNLPAALFTPSWPAELELAYARHGERTTPVQRRHLGPLRVQKHLYAEGPQVCQHIIVHPPGGIAGGDRLDISADAGENTWVQLTSPGAAKWYRASEVARQDLRLSVAAGATLEWLPQETILYAGAQAELHTQIELQGDARLFYWDIIALGRPAADERFSSGHFQAALDIRRDGKLLWHERQRVTGDDGLLDSPLGLDGQPVFATLLVSGEVPGELLERCREVQVAGVRGDLSQLSGLLIARCLASETLKARAWLIALWCLLRPALLGREAMPPRIWST